MTRGQPRRSQRSRFLAAALALAAMLFALLAVPSAAGAANTATVFYRPSTSWSTVNIHYAPDGASWTAVPGVAMPAACDGWRSYTINLGSATGAQVVFNNGSGTWDNNNHANYRVGTGRTTIANSAVTANAADPCAPVVPDTTAPSVPQGVSATVNATTVILSWTAATDDKAVTGYRLTIANFSNASGLERAGNNTWVTSANSGQKIVNTPGVGGAGSTMGGSIEMSNVDLSQTFTNMITAQRGFQANSRVISTADEMLQDLVNLKR